MPAGRSGCRYRRSPGVTSCFLFVFVISVSSFCRRVFSFPVRYHIEDMHKVDAMVSRQRCWAASSGSLHSFRSCRSLLFRYDMWRTARASDKAGTENVRVVPPAHRNETQSPSHACACMCSFNLSFTLWACVCIPALPSALVFIGSKQPAQTTLCSVPKSAFKQVRGGVRRDWRQGPVLHVRSQRVVFFSAGHRLWPCPEATWL